MNKTGSVHTAFSIERMHRLALIFNRASGISAVFLDEQGQILADAGFSTVRDRLHMMYPELFDTFGEYAPRIAGVLINSTEKEHLDRNWIYSRLSGFELDGHRFYLLLGCVFLKEKYAREDAFRFAQTVGLDRRRFRKAIDIVPEVDQAGMDDAVQFFREMLQLMNSPDASESLLESRMEPIKVEEPDRDHILSRLALASWEMDIEPDDRITSAKFSMETGELTGIHDVSRNPDRFLDLGSGELREAISLVQPGQSSRFTMDIRDRRGETRWIEHTALVERHRDGRVRVSGLSRDISQRKQDEMKLARSEKRFFELADFLPETVYETDATGRIVYMNRAGQKSFSIEQSDLEGGLDHRVLIADEDRQRSEELVRATLKGEQCEPDEFTAIDRTEKRIPVIIHASPIMDNGICSGSRGLIIDISQTKAAERTIEISLEKYKVLFDIFPIGISLTDPDGNMVEVNPASEKILGISMDDHRSRRHDSPDWKVIYPDGTPMSTDNFASVRALRENRMVEVYESGMIQKDGSITWINMKAAPIPLDNFGVAIAFTDITERHLAKKELELSENKWRSLSENAPDVIITTDRDGTIKYCNKPIGEIPVELLIGTSIFYWSLPTQVDEFRECFEMCARTGQPGKIESPGIGPDGKVLWYSIHMGPVLTRGMVTGMTMIFSDITEQKRVVREKQEMEIKMLASSKLATLGEMATGMAHEINQPLNFISVFLQLLEEDIESDSLNTNEIRHNLRSSLHAVGRITTIIDHLRVFGRAHSDDTGPVELPGLFDNTLVLFSEKLRRNRIRVNIDMPADLPPITANANKLEQVFVNLIQNSLDALLSKEESRTISIIVHRKGDRLLINFSDNGKGMTDTELPRIFEPFYTTKEPGQGTGLGLSIVHGIIMDFGGTITARSEPNIGTTFLIELPIGRQ